MSLLITGATGSIGSTYLKYALDKFQNIKLYSRNEYRQWLLKQEIQQGNIGYILGDIRDYETLSSAMSNTDIVVHAAAMKHVSTCQQNIMESVKTNIIGTSNIIKASKCNNVGKVVLISTDKSVCPSNIYGMTKHISEELFLQEHPLKFKVIRFGNYIGSTGSVLEIYKNLIKKGAYALPLTDKRCTRYWLTPDELNKTIHQAVLSEDFNQIYTPIAMKSFKIIDLITALGCSYFETGLTPGEKLHEQLDENHSSEESNMSVEEIKELLRSYI